MLINLENILHVFYYIYMKKKPVMSYPIKKNKNAHINKNISRNTRSCSN